MNTALFFHRTALATPGAPALLLGSRLIADHAELHRRIVGTARWLEQQGVGKGDRVALFMRNHVEYLEWLLAVLWIGAIVVPVNFKLHPRELDYILQDSGSSLLVVCSEGAATLGRGALVWSGRQIDTDLATHRLPHTAEGPAAWAPVALPADACAWLFYTSGTTGRPKGVEIMHRNILAMTLAYVANIDTICADDAMLYAAPMSHGAGLYAFPAMLAGARHVIPESSGFVPREILALAQSVGRICLFAAPTMVRRLVDAAEGDPAGIDGIKTIAYGGGPMYVADIRRALSVMGARFVQVYGQGESPMTISALSRSELADADHADYAARLASVGRAMAPVEVAVMTADGAAAAPGVPGEVVVRGDAVMRGYWNNPEASAAALRNGWLHTGDIGSLSADGFLTLLDRSKDMIISGGSNIYPREVEEVLLTFPGIREACVIGVPDEEWGEAVVAYLVAEPGNLPDAASLDRHCLDAMARFKRPRDYRFIDALPKNHYGKVLKTAMRAAALAEAGQARLSSRS